MTKQEEIRERINEYAMLREGPTGDADEDYAALCRELTALGVVLESKTEAIFPCNRTID